MLKTPTGGCGGNGVMGSNADSWYLAEGTKARRHEGTEARRENVVR